MQDLLFKIWEFVKIQKKTMSVPNVFNIFKTMLNHNHLTGCWNPCIWWYVARLNSACSFQLCFCFICVQLKTITRKVRCQLYITSAEIILSPEQRIRLLWTSARCVHCNTGRMTDGPRQYSHFAQPTKTRLGKP